MTAPTAAEHAMNDLFAMIRESSLTEWEKGARFEHLIKRGLERHPGEYGPKRFKQIWGWQEWPDRTRWGFAGNDIGIDLVGAQTEAHGGGLCAIQCKFWKKQPVPTKQVDSFLAAATSKVFHDSLLVLTTDVTKHATSKIVNARPRCQVLHSADLARWPFDWGEFIDRPDDLAHNQKLHRPHPYQRQAVQALTEGLAKAGSKGKLILPCGTGKSAVALWAAERIAGTGGKVLYLVPSISLMGQTMREWARQSQIPHSYLGVCSDPTSGRAAGGQRDLCQLAMRVSTDQRKITDAMCALDAPAAGRHLNVVFSTYHSLPLIAEAQDCGAPVFDLIVCDEAHRTTGIETAHRKRSGFRLVHNNNRVRGRRRLFMTATPRVFTERAKLRAKIKQVDSFSMDDDKLYGPVLYKMSFADAIDGNWLSDYRVVVLAASEEKWRASYEGNPSVAHAETGISFQDYVKLVGCWDALADPRTTRPGPGRAAGQVPPHGSGGHCRTAIAFTNRIRTSKLVAKWWPVVIENAAGSDPAPNGSPQRLKLDITHLDGSSSAKARQTAILKLRERPRSGSAQCSVLTNAQVLTEGVDVPALDAVLFLERRTSKIDVTQAVGRVLRKAQGKAYGFVVIPVIVPEGGSITDEQVLNGSDFKVLWDVVRALRSHDERVDYWVNNLNAAKNRLQTSHTGNGHDDGAGGVILILGDHTSAASDAVLQQLRLETGDKIASKLVDVCGDRQMWPHWGERAAEICGQVRHRVSTLIREDMDLNAAFRRFVDAMAKTVGPQITDRDAEEMVAQHVVTIPVFDKFFDKSEFAARNPVSEQINRLLEVFADKGWTFEHERRPLTRAYRRMAEAFEGALTGGEKLDVLREVYDGFFQKAMRAQVKRLGIAYTPVELVDFILKSADAVCRQEFGRGVTAEGVNVLDPFTGTGTFVNRLLTLKNADGEHLIRDEDLARKFTGTDNDPPEIHANEIVLLAYYIAALKIEEGAEERGLFDSVGYQPFEGIVLTDTFRMTHKQMHPQLPGSYMRKNSLRATAQNKLPIQVILGNPPWSAGQKSSGDDNPNIGYPKMSKRVRDTYSRRHKKITGRAPGGNSAGNLYVQAIRWASDRLTGPDAAFDSGGVVAFVHPNSLTSGTSLAGMRAALRDEFTGIYVVNLRGDAYKSGRERRREGDNVFGQASRNGVQITVLVRNPDKDLSEPAVLRYAEVAEYSSRAEKFEWLARLGDVTGGGFVEVPVVPQHHWVNLPDGTFEEMLPVCSTTKADTQTAVAVSASGVKTNCDVYAYSFSRSKLVRKMRDLVDAYEDARELVSLGEPVEEVTKNEELDVIKWTDTLKQTLKKDVPIEFDESRIREVLYRPFTKLWLYEDSRILSSVKTVSAMFPRTEESLSLSLSLRCGILVNQTQQLPFAGLAAGGLFDLCATGRQTRVLARRS